MDKFTGGDNGGRWLCGEVDEAALLLAQERTALMALTLGGPGGWLWPQEGGGSWLSKTPWLWLHDERWVSHMVHGVLVWT